MAGHYNESHSPQGNGSAQGSAVALARGLGWVSVTIVDVSCGVRLGAGFGHYHPMES